MKAALTLIGLLLISIVAAYSAERDPNVVVKDYWSDWWFNWILWWATGLKMLSCGGWALFGVYFYNDNGAMGERCFKTGLVGGRATYDGLPIPWEE